MTDTVYFRPLDNSFLDSMIAVKQEAAFWITKQGLLRDFPNEEVVAYTNDDIANFCNEHGIPFSMVKIYA